MTRASYMRAYRDRMRALGLPDGDPRHGLVTGYATYRCKCDLCLAANAAAQRRLYHARKAQPMPRPTTRDRTKLPAPETPPQRQACGVRLDPDTVDALDALAERHGGLRSDIIRGAIAYALRAPQKIRPVQ